MKENIFFSLNQDEKPSSQSAEKAPTGSSPSGKYLRLWTGWYAFVKLVVREFTKNQCLQRASAMAYASLLAMVPLITLSLSLFTRFVEMPNIKTAIFNKIVSHFIPKTGNTLFDTVSEHLDQFVANAAAINVLGIIGLALTSISLFGTVENSFNHVWKVEKPRSFFARYNTFCGMIIGIPLLIGGSLYLTYLFKMQFLWNAFPLLKTFSITAFPILLTWGAFILIYHQVPFTRVHWGPAIIGGIVAGSLWEMAKIGFGFYVSKAVTVNVIYGSLGALPLFLLWLYLTWAIVLLGAQISYVAQYRKNL